MQYSQNNPDNVYLNIRIENTSGTQFSSLARYDVTKDFPIIYKASDYYAALISCNIPLSDIPILIYPIVPNQPNPNLAPMTVTITYNGFDYTENLIFVTEDSRDSPPIQNLPYQVITPYYFVYSYDSMIESFNTALATAFANSGMPGTAPYFFIDYDYQLIKLVVSNYFNPATANYAQLSINEYSNIYIDAFDFRYNGPSVKDFTFNLNTSNNVCNENGAELGIPGGGYWLFSQNYYYLDSWLSIRKILIVSSSLSVYKEYISPDSQLGNQLSTAPSFNILFDFTPELGTISLGRAVSRFYPIGQYRLVDLTSNEPVTRISLQVYWQDKKGNIYPLSININQSLDIKIGFFKKSLYKYTSSLL